MLSPLHAQKVLRLISYIQCTLLVDKIFWGYQPCQLGKDYRRLRDHLCPKHRVWCDVIFNQTALPEKFISNSAAFNSSDLTYIASIMYVSGVSYYIRGSNWLLNNCNSQLQIIITLSLISIPITHSWKHESFHSYISSLVRDRIRVTLRQGRLNCCWS
jgi:hypothetical protein